ncbi:hypothetical protein SO802_006131 [Lithocarpus litseifolius]|uniref:Uncharacterized protein n=1 Tax=Lithocarpus litseifolius TaxID=425828 RepID=A0AAW2DN04_9ROSI
MDNTDATPLAGIVAKAAETMAENGVAITSLPVCTSLYCITGRSEFTFKVDVKIEDPEDVILLEDMVQDGVEWQRDLFS